MHTIEPFYNWRDIYTAESDRLSPSYKRKYSEFEFSNKVYNYYIHPQWDNIGSSTLYLKLLFADYRLQFAVIELMGEWNDTLHNDIMILKQNVIDVLIRNKINRFMIIGENVLNFHAGDDCYYEEWYSEISESDGWIAAVNFRPHVIAEMRSIRLHHFIFMSDRLSELNWRTFKPNHLPLVIEDILLKKIG